MYFWKIEKLKSELKNGILSEQQVLTYFLSLMTIWMATSFFNRDSIQSTLPDYLIILTSILLTLVGTLLAFEANGGSSGANFLNRYMSLTWVLSIRLAVFAVPVFLLGFIISIALSGKASAGTDYFLPFFVPGWIGLFYWRLYSHFRDVADQKSPKNSLEAAEDLQPDNCLPNFKK